ncbi:unnamed protein product [Victoria cruziana]
MGGKFFLEVAFADRWASSITVSISSLLQVPSCETVPTNLPSSPFADEEMKMHSIAVKSCRGTVQPMRRIIYHLYLPFKYSRSKHFVGHLPIQVGG